MVTIFTSHLCLDVMIQSIIERKYLFISFRFRDDTAVISIPNASIIREIIRKPQQLVEQSLVSVLLDIP